jgi:cellulose synthase operon protein YhjQ
VHPAYLREQSGPQTRDLEDKEPVGELMESRRTDGGNESLVAGTPDDVAMLYSWANLHGAKYRDFSASRREYRAQIRYRAAQALRDRELRAAAEADAAAATAERAAAQAEAVARSQGSNDSQILRMQALREAEASARKAAADRMEASRRAQAAAAAQAAAMREEREIAQAHASAERQAANYTESEMRRRYLAGPQPRGPMPGQPGDPYTGLLNQGPGGAHSDTFHSDRERMHSTFEDEDDESGEPANQPLTIMRLGIANDAAQRRREGYHPDEASGVWNIKRDLEQVPEPLPAIEQAPEAWQHVVEQEPIATPEPLLIRAEALQSEDAQTVRVRNMASNLGPLAPSAFEAAREISKEEALINPDAAFQRFAQKHIALPKAAGDDEEDAIVNRLPDTPRTVGRNAPAELAPAFNPEGPTDPVPDRMVAIPQEDEGLETPPGPAWLYTQEPRQNRVASAISKAMSRDTLQDSRERVASRWFALKGVFEHAGPELPALQPVQSAEIRTPLLAVFSLSGGVGKTSLVATLGRALSSMGEKVLLTDTTSHGLLPFYFGARELRPGIVRTFSPPSGSTDAPIHLVSYDVEHLDGNDTAQESLVDSILKSAQGTNRLILDLSPGSAWMIRRIAPMHPVVLIPVAPDMNSVISLQSIERLFQEITTADGRAVQPFYVLNQFDAALPLHLDVREVFRRQLGDRLLRFVIRRSPAVSEALAEGMTVVDYAPDQQVSQDYLEVAQWLRSVSAPATAGFRNARWSEQ